MTITVMSYFLMFGLVLTGSSIIVILMDQHDNAYRDFAVLGLFSSALILLSYYLELNEPGLTAKLSAVKFGYMGRVFVSPMLIMLVSRYYDFKISRMLQGFLYLVPILVLCFVFSFEDHLLYYSSVELDTNGLLLVEAGPVYYLYMCYNTAQAMAYFAFCLYQRASLRGREKRANTLLILSGLLPFLSLIVYLAGWTNGYDISVLGVMIGSMIAALAIFRYGMLNKDEMLQSMATGLIFLDSEYRLVYANRAAMQIIPQLMTQTRTNRQDLSVLCSDHFSAIQVGTATYQRRMDEWSSDDGQHGKLLTFDDITEIRARLNRDAMTGLLNHATFYPMLDEALAYSRENGGKVTVAISDIDSFKRVNDTYGHVNGDIILIALADMLTEVCGNYGDVFRYGGEEFAVIFNCGSKRAEKIMQEALDRFSQLQFEFMTGHVTFSFGTAEYNGSETSVMLFDRADQIMYTRKRQLHERERLEAEQNSPAVPADAHV